MISGDMAKARRLMTQETSAASSKGCGLPTGARIAAESSATLSIMASAGTMQNRDAMNKKGSSKFLVETPTTGPSADTRKPAGLPTASGGEMTRRLTRLKVA